MKNEGYYLSIEAIISMLLLGLLLAMPLYEGRPGLYDLHVFKKENDMLLLWARQPERLSEAQLLQDFEFAFGGKSGLIVWNGKSIAIGKGEESVSSKAVFFDRQMKRHEIRLVVFKQDLP